MNKTNAVQQTKMGSTLSPAQGLLQRQCACGNHTVAGGECAACAKNKTGLQRKLSIGASNDPLELEADRIADQVVASKAAPLSVSNLASGQLQREEAPKEKTNEEKYQEGLEKLGEAFLETPVGKELLEKMKQDKLAKGATDFVSTWPGKIVTGAAATGAVAALAATHKELPAQIPEIPLGGLIPGLSVKLTYKGPVDKPTEAMITFKFTEQAPKGSADKKTISETDKNRAETARMTAKFRAGLRYPPGSLEDLQEKAEQEAIKRAALRSSGGPNIEATIKKYPWLAAPQLKSGLQLTMPKPSFGTQPPSLFGDEFKLKLPGEQKKKQDEPALQKKLSIGASNDPLEQEADRVADQVMAAAPLRHSAANTTAPRIQRVTGQMSEGTNAAPDSVDRVLSSSGRPLEPALQQDMEQRFGHDFSRVRVHTGSAAEQSARDVNAHAYTVGSNIVFGFGRFSAETYDGRRLLAHELAHTIQQNSIKPQKIIQRAGFGDLHLAEARDAEEEARQKAQSTKEEDSPKEKAEPMITPIPVCAKPYAPAKNFQQLIELVRAAETRLSAKGVVSVKDQIHAMRGIYYGTLWSRDYTGVPGEPGESSVTRNEGFQRFTRSSEEPGKTIPLDVRPLLDCNLFDALKLSQDLKESDRQVDFGHLIIALDARYDPDLTRNVTYPYGPFGIKKVDMGGTGTELVTWLGDLGGGAAKVAITRATKPADAPNAKPAFDKPSDYGGTINLEGDIAGFVAASGSAESVSIPSIPAGKGLSDALQDYLSPGAPSSVWKTRAATFLEMYGGKLDSSGVLTNRSAMISIFPPKIETFACNYLASRVKDAHITFNTAKQAADNVVPASEEVAEAFVDALADSAKTGGAIEAKHFPVQRAPKTGTCTTQIYAGGAIGGLKGFLGGDKN